MIRVLVVDDSGVVRANLAHILATDPDIQVIGSVSCGREALAFVERQKPDVITMDIHMPDMNGYEATRRIMESTPIPIIIISATWEPKEQISSFKAIEAGALVCLPKPPGPGHPGYTEAMAELIASVKQMACVKVVRRWPKRPPVSTVPGPSLPPVKQPIQIIAIGASTGGPPAIQQFLALLPADFPVPILIVQHIARGFVGGFVDWLNTSSPLPVHLATNHDPIWKGHVYVAPDDLQMGVADGGRIVLSDTPPEHFLRPAVSYLFRSVAETYGQASVGILLTGMGKDGAAELQLIKDAGGLTFAQDKESSVVHGMPGEAIRLGAASHVLHPAAMASSLVQMLPRPLTESR
jgi:two-component system chemotaxis response regulator CheB